MTDGTTDTDSQAAGKKGIPVWGWVLIGCGGLIVVGFLLFAAAGYFVVKKGVEAAKEMTGVESFDEFQQALKDNPVKLSAETAIRMNPELEIVESDDEAGTLTFKNTRTGEVATFNYEDIAEGKFSLSTEEGEFAVDASESADGGVVYRTPEGETRIGASASLDDVPDWVPSYPTSEETLGSYSSRTADGAAGMVSVKTADGAQDVISHFENWFGDHGWEIASRSMSAAGGNSFGSIVGESKGEGRSLSIGAMEQADGTQVTINYNEKTPQ